MSLIGAVSTQVGKERGNRGGKEAKSEKSKKETMKKSKTRREGELDGGTWYSWVERRKREF